VLKGRPASMRTVPGRYGRDRWRVVNGWWERP